MTLVPGRRLGPYRDLAALGAGGMRRGVPRAGPAPRAHRGAQDPGRRTCGRTRTCKRASEREARTISQLTHPHICTVYDIGREGDVDFLVMEFLEGETLAARIARGAIPVATCAADRGRDCLGARARAPQTALSIVT